MVKKFCERLKELRLEKNISTTKLAENVGVSDATISRWENGLRTPIIDNLVSLAKFFDVSADYLIGLSDFEWFINLVKDLKN